MKISDDIVINHGLTPSEYEKIKKLISREPNMLELGIFQQCGMSTVLINLQRNT